MGVIRHTRTVLLTVVLDVLTKPAMLPNTMEMSVRNSDVWRNVKLTESAAKDDTTALILETDSSVT